MLKLVEGWEAVVADVAAMVTEVADVVVLVLLLCLGRVGRNQTMLELVDLTLAFR